MSLTTLPSEVLSEIALTLDPYSLAKLEQTCKRTKRVLASDSRPWKMLHALMLANPSGTVRGRRAAVLLPGTVCDENKPFEGFGPKEWKRHHHWSSPIVRFRDVGVREKKRVGVRRAGAAAPVCDDLAASAGASGDLRKGRYRTGFVEGPGGGAGSGSAFLSTPRLPTSANIPCTRITRGARTSISNGSTPPAPSSPPPSSASWAPQTGPPSHRPPLEASSLQTFDKCVTCLM
ncbi:hypothetical protein BDK51DRAFT_45923 [Blyttiomyces helicus]|uniref:F-box domain-containing protein n=1 Tax=Blyttiomyces helicus TaxID=388810 RepID=A0A4P9W513_9FUNG|nr:hypothetical protein BDK51DRAFT_45923 [Blyttiomyces helicus]|eukprot:RKO86393.1 hypothetical protein BDK51DRAFT_45923 [Blyttiomyces helicus]